MLSILRFFVERPFITFLLLLGIAVGGLMVSPFAGLRPASWPSSPIAVDAIPDLGENQQIVQTAWPGMSPSDVDEYITYPLSSRLLGIAGVRSIRSSSMLGLSSLYVIFEDGYDFYDSRSRILEKLSSLPAGSLPDGVQPQLGPDATALGQVFWYTLEAKTEQGKSLQAWGLDSLRSVQDYLVKDALSAVPGVAEVASVGGFVREYHIMPQADKLDEYGLSLVDIARAVQQSNSDTGLNTLEMNQAEYLIRTVGAVRDPKVLGEALIKMVNGVPIRVKDVAMLQAQAAERRGVLDKNGREMVGGVVVARFDANPAEVIAALKERISRLQTSLPQKVLSSGEVVQMQIVPFYDRSILINETLHTLAEALRLEIWVTLLVIWLMLRRFSSTVMVASVLPIAVLMVFLGMKLLGITANIVALSGIAIAIGTMVDLGIIMSERIEDELRRSSDSGKEAIIRAASSVAKPIATAVATTVISFLPVFGLQAAEGKLFHPLAWTKTLGLIAALLVTLVFIPSFAYVAHRWTKKMAWSFSVPLWGDTLVALLLLLGLSISWQPLGPSVFFLWQFLLLAAVIFGLYGMFEWLRSRYIKALQRSFAYRPLIYSTFAILLVFTFIWSFGAKSFTQPLSKILPELRESRSVQSFEAYFPGIGSEFMPALDEGEFLLMPTSMPHAGVAQNQAVLRLLDEAVANIPEVEFSVGKLGRVESALDPAPISMYENVIRYKPEFAQNEQGAWVRQWRDHIKSADDIWNEIAQATRIPGVTGAPKLQPIETRLVMLQTGLRAPMGLKVQGERLEDIEQAGFALEALLKEVPGVKTSAVFAERITGKPYLNIVFDRNSLAEHGFRLQEAQAQLQAAVGGLLSGFVLDGRARYAIKVRYPKSLRNSPDMLANLRLRSPLGYELALKEIAQIAYEKGPQSIRREDTFLTGFVLFDRMPDYSAGEVAKAVDEAIQQKLKGGELRFPSGVQYTIAGSWEQQQRAEARLRLIVPAVLLSILGILYLQFQSFKRSMLVFAGVLPALVGGFLCIAALHNGWLGEQWQINLSVAVWVGFIALFGIATDDSVLMGTYIQDNLDRLKASKAGLRRAIVVGSARRLRPAMMTSLTTILALLPVLIADGRGADLMLPMALPIFGGMLFAGFNWFFTPLLYLSMEERK